MGKTIEIPEGYTAKIEGNKVVIEPKESEDERIKNLLYCLIRDRSDNGKLLEHNGVSVDMALAWIEKQGKPKMAANAIREGVAHYGITQYQIDNWLKKYVEVESTEPKSPAWSEEDEAVLDALIRRLEGEDIYVSPHLAVECLKSLKERYTWKPSDKQIDDLEYIMKYYPNIRGMVNSIYTCLKKLKG